MHIRFEMAACTTSSSIWVDERIGTLSTENFVRRKKETGARMAMFPPKYKPLHKSNTLLLVISCCRSSFSFSLRLPCWMFHFLEFDYCHNSIFHTFWSNASQLCSALVICRCKAFCLFSFFMKRQKHAPSVFNPRPLVTQSKFTSVFPRSRQLQFWPLFPHFPPVLVHLQSVRRVLL